MGVFVFVDEYEYLPAGGNNEGPAPWSWTVHSPFSHCHRHSGIFLLRFCGLATPGRRQDDKPLCQVTQWLIHCGAQRDRKANTPIARQDASGEGGNSK